VPGHDPEAVEHAEQHHWVVEEWEELDGTTSCEHFCLECFQALDYTKPIDEQFYSVCSEYEEDDDGKRTQADNSG
jgi:hypothetical protein